jgi:hypothetical protein
MITGWMFRALPGPRLVRLVVVTAAYVGLGWVCWRYVFPMAATDWLGASGMSGIAG